MFNGMRLPAALLISALLAACGGSEPCTATLSGGVSRSLACGAGVGGAFNLAIALDPKEGHDRSFSFVLQVVPQTLRSFQADYQTSSAGVVVNASITDAAGATWTLAAGDQVSPVGSYRVHLSNLGDRFVGTDFVEYPDARGTIDATLEPVESTGARGQVQLHSDFQDTFPRSALH